MEKTQPKLTGYVTDRDLARLERLKKRIGPISYVPDAKPIEEPK